jgi:serine protease Do
MLSSHPETPPNMRLPLLLAGSICLATPLLARDAGPRSRPAAGDALQARIYAARDEVLPALVHVEPIVEVYARGQRAKAAVTGSGVIVDREGHVLTNDHVVANATRVTCILFDKREMTATVVGRDSATDVAVLRLDLPEGAKIPHATLGTSATLEAGQHVLAMGSPLGLARSISAGVVSTPDRYFPEDALPTGETTGLYNTWIQTDAAINPGNSGGPLVDLDGRVVGINARAVPIFGENIGFAIPIDVVKEVAGQLIATGKVSRAWIGARFQNTKELAGWFGAGDRGGVLVGGIVPGSPADRAGLLAGDVIVEWNGEPVSARFEEELPAFRKRVAQEPAGSAVPILVVRNGKEMPLKVTVEASPESLDDSETDLAPWGFTAKDVTPDIVVRRRITDTKGAFVTGVKGAAPAAVAGLDEGDVIRSVDGKPVTSAAALREILKERTDAKAARVLVAFDRGVTHRMAVLERDVD